MYLASAMLDHNKYKDKVKKCLIRWDSCPQSTLKAIT